MAEHSTDDVQLIADFLLDHYRGCPVEHIDELAFERCAASAVLRGLHHHGRLRQPGERVCDALCRDVERERDALLAELGRLPPPNTITAEDGYTDCTVCGESVMVSYPVDGPPRFTCTPGCSGRTALPRDEETPA